MSDAFPLSGSIDPAAFPFLLMDLHHSEATGSLRVEGPTYQKALYYRGGRILFGSSNDPRDQLGAILIESGKISPEQLEDVNAKVGPGNPLARVLSESGFVNQRELSEAARAKVERILSDVIAYDSGSFEFEDGVLPRGAIDLKLATEKLTLAAVRRVTDRAFVLRFLESLEVVLAPTAELNDRLAEIQDEAGGLPEQLDGARTLKEAASLARLEEFEAGKVACALYFLGLVEKDASASAAPVAEAEPEMAFDAGGSVDLGTDGGFDLGVEDATVEEPAFFVSPEPGAAVPSEVEPGSADETMVMATDDDAPLFEPEMAPAPTFEPEPMPEPEPAAAPIPEPEPAPEPPAPPPPPPPPPEPEPSFAVPDPTTTTKPPSKEDLAALDQLLNSRAPEGPLEPLETSHASEKWEPAFGAGGSTPYRGKKPRSKLPAILGGIAAVALVAGGAAWYFLMGPGAAMVAEQIVDPAPVAEPAPPAGAEVEPTAEDPGASRPAAPGDEETSPPAEAPEPSEAEAVPPTTAAAAPAASPPPTTTPATTVAPRPTASTSRGGGSLTGAREQLQAGEHAAAAAGFASAMRAQPRGVYTLQVLVACAGETVSKAVDNAYAPQLYVLPVHYQGRDCYRVCWGVFASEAAASGAASEVPAYFTQGGARPKAVSLASVLP